ncbi:amidohydrolase [Aeromicrobium sp. SMF47]|uniref:Amidohydrolase n=1 Tax=Aeromicrobium yanjiei TaxID=2662028 RepID=A0A5Q2MBK1_9ACTN|nr:MULTISPECIES: amidohydrolase [Aeromicrobium]MRJ75047.1 amidohydrolase [Aeromicrobium yanjiei]MRK02897.1 amidohydrolase [Aeromicrobium sp. S22]QGG40464.1 amidohydrolase [Aeromicrobium yanjiei]
MSLIESLARSIDVVTPDLIEVRRDLHSSPELSWHEERTTDVVATWMDKIGVPYERFEGTGLMAEIGPSEGPIVALRADLDALPVIETSQDPWRSTVPGVSHSCGHDVHVASLLGAGIALAHAHADHGLPFHVRLLFQPAEEVMPGGALKLLAAGALKGVSRIFALHCDPSLDVGQVGLREGPITGASDHVHVVLSGRGGHTSRPHLTEDLTYALGSLLVQLPAVLSRRFDPRAGASLVWGQVQSGNAANVIPSSGELRGTIRMLDASAWHQAEHLVRGIISDLIEPFGVSAEVNYTRGVPPVVNDFGATQVLRRAVTEAIGPSGVATTSQSLGGEDFAWYVEAVPGAMGRLGTRTPDGPTYDLHQGNLRVDERAIAVGAKVLASAAVS